MLQLKRFVAFVCALLMVPSGCAAASYEGGAAPYYPPTVDARAPMSPAEPGSGGESMRNFESVASVAAGSSSEDMWSGGDVDGLSAGNFRVEGANISTATAAAPPPPPPAPVFGGQPAPAKEAPEGKKLAEDKAVAPTSQPAGAKGAKGEATSATSIRAPMLIYTGHVQMAVYEVRNSLGEVESLAKAMGGFLAKRDDRSITIRVPAAHFDEAMRRIEKMGDMLSRNVQVEDVTEEFNDVDIRLKNARAVRERLEQLLSKATKVEESIEIERELERVALTIERLEGRMKFLKDRAAFSTITVTFHPRSAAEIGKRHFTLPVPWLYGLGIGRLLSL